jgi:hypothetical protein
VDPPLFDSLVLSDRLARCVLLGGIGFLHLKAHVAALAGLAVALAVAVLGFGNGS